jgi:hypothetical protein
MSCRHHLVEKVTGEAGQGGIHNLIQSDADML